MQDFPITAAPGAAPTDLPDIYKDRQPFRVTLRCFVKQLAWDRFPIHRPSRLAIFSPFRRLLKGVDFRGAKGTLLASLPTRGLQYAPTKRGAGPPQFNAVRGLRKALGGHTWPEAARSAPINYLTGALGNMALKPWVESFVLAAMAGGAHGSAVDEAGELLLRVLWPTNATAFSAAAEGEPELAVRSLAHNWHQQYGTYGRVSVSMCIRRELLCLVLV